MFSLSSLPVVGLGKPPHPRPGMHEPFQQGMPVVRKLASPPDHGPAARSAGVPRAGRGRGPLGEHPTPCGSHHSTASMAAWLPCVYCWWTAASYHKSAAFRIEAIRSGSTSVAIDSTRTPGGNRLHQAQALTVSQRLKFMHRRPSSAL